MTGSQPQPPPLTIAQLAERWAITEEAARRRVKKIALPAFNVGCASEPDWRYRLATVEKWEEANERLPEELQIPVPDVAVRPGMPAGWGDFDPLGPKKAKAKGRARA